LPALKERKEDIKALADYYANFFALKSNRKPFRLTDEYIRALEANNWKGNIRELRNVIERSVILAEADTLDVDTLPLDLQYAKMEGKVLSAFSMASAEKLHIQKILNHTGGNKAEAARLLEIGVATLYRKIDEYKILS